MANEEHLEILKSGVEAWNEWRRCNKSTKPDLSRADLADAQLGRINLCDADLGEANLRNAICRSHISHGRI